MSKGLSRSNLEADQENDWLNVWKITGAGIQDIEQISTIMEETKPYPGIYVDLKTFVESWCDYD